MMLVLAGQTNVSTKFELMWLLTGQSYMEYFAFGTRRVAHQVGLPYYRWLIFQSEVYKG
jgi:hypothetical protein